MTTKVRVGIKIHESSEVNNDDPMFHSSSECILGIVIVMTLTMTTITITITITISVSSQGHCRSS